MDAESNPPPPAARGTLLHPRYVPTWAFLVAAALIPVTFVAGLVLAIVTIVYQQQYLTALGFCVFIPFMATLGYAFSVFIWHTAGTQEFPATPFRIPLLEAFHRAAMLVFVQIFALLWCGSLVGMVTFGIWDVIRRG